MKLYGDKSYRGLTSCWRRAIDDHACIAQSLGLEVVVQEHRAKAIACRLDSPIEADRVVIELCSGCPKSSGDPVDPEHDPSGTFMDTFAGGPVHLLASIEGYTSSFPESVSWRTG